MGKLRCICLVKAEFLNRCDSLFSVGGLPLLLIKDKQGQTCVDVAKRELERLQQLYEHGHGAHVTLDAQKPDVALERFDFLVAFLEDVCTDSTTSAAAPDQVPAEDPAKERV